MKTPALLLVLSLCVPACGGDDDDVAGADAAVDNDAPTAASIPDPGTAMDDWIPAPDDWCTPEQAHAVGIVTQSPGYVEGTLCTDTGSGFYVFRAGPALTEFSIGFFGGTAAIDYVHLHEGDGLVFGDLITPTESTATSGTWPVTPDSIYVLEAHAPGGGFF